MNLLNDTCTLQARTVNTSGMTDTETWADVETVPCRKLTRTAVLQNAERTQHATAIKTRFVLPVDASIEIRGRIVHNGRTYEVAEVIIPFGRTGQHHKVAVCEVIV